MDFKKAFDSIPRALLFQKLSKMGIKGNFFNVIKTMYSNDRVCIRLGDNLTESFNVNQGVKQGCVLSPLLFNIFLSDLPGIFSDEDLDAVHINQSESINCLIWADDVVLLSESDAGLQKLITKLSEYSEHNRLKINIDKTKAMVFNKTGRLFRAAYKLNNEFIYTTNSYKYLGFLLNPCGGINKGLNNLKDRALRAYYGLKKKMGIFFRKHISTTLGLFNALIKPILLYASDFWGCLKLPKNNPIENLQIRFYKELLGVQKQTTNVGVLLELGEVPITFYAKKYAIKNYVRIVSNTSSNCILNACLLNTSPASNTWMIATINCLNTIGTGTDNLHNISENAFKRVSDIFHQEAFENINKADSKLRTFGRLKRAYGLEKYLLHPMKPEHRIAISKLRLSNHDLMIEKGRHSKIVKTQRFCSFCKDSVETEQHFLLHCPTFICTRTKLFNDVGAIIPHFNGLIDNAKFVCLLNNINISALVGEYIYNTFLCRKYLLEYHKNWD